MEAAAHPPVSASAGHDAAVGAASSEVAVAAVAKMISPLTTSLPYSPHWNCYATLCSVAQSCLSLCDPLDCSSPGSSLHGIFQARILEWVAISFSKWSNLCLLHCRWILWTEQSEKPTEISDWFKWMDKCTSGCVWDGVSVRASFWNSQHPCPMEQMSIAWRTSQIKAGVQVLDSQFKIKVSNFM